MVGVVCPGALKGMEGAGKGALGVENKGATCLSLGREPLGAL